MLDQLSSRLNEIRENKKVQENIVNFITIKLNSLNLENFRLNIEIKYFEKYNVFFNVFYEFPWKYVLSN